MTIDFVAETQNLSLQVAEEIRVTMARRQVRQSELARRLGVNDTWLSVRLRGLQEIGLNDLGRIAAALEIPVLELFPVPLRSRNSEPYLPVATDQPISQSIKGRHQPNVRPTHSRDRPPGRPRDDKRTISIRPELTRSADFDLVALRDLLDL